MKYLLWLLKAAIFFTLFAFALNNQHDAAVHLFFGTRWQAPMVLVVLTAFAAGVVVGVLGMVPRWWQQRSAAHHAAQAVDTPKAPAPPSGAAPTPPLHNTLPPSMTHGL